MHEKCKIKGDDQHYAAINRERSGEINKRRAREANEGLSGRGREGRKSE